MIFKASFVFLFAMQVVFSQRGGINTANKSPTENSGDYYLDIDILQLKGVEKISTINYPCIEINESPTKKIIIFHRGPGKNVKEEFLFKDNIWISAHEFKGDTCMIYEDTYILKDKVVTFSFSDSERRKLIDLIVLAKAKESIYMMPKTSSITPSLKNMDYLIKSAESTYITEYVNSDKTVRQIQRRFDKTGVQEFSEETCYYSSPRSVYWWRNFSSTQKATVCVPDKM